MRIHLPLLSVLSGYRCRAAHRRAHKPRRRPNVPRSSFSSPSISFAATTWTDSTRSSPADSRVSGHAARSFRTRGRITRIRRPRRATRRCCPAASPCNGDHLEQPRRSGPADAADRRERHRRVAAPVQRHDAVRLAARARPSARVLSVSRKDRGAILPIGRAKGDIYWFAGGKFTTSRYYADTLPTWVTDIRRRDSLRSARRHAVEAAAARATRIRSRIPCGPRTTAPTSCFRMCCRRPTRSAPGSQQYPWMDSLTLAFALDGVRATRVGKRSMESTSREHDARPALDLAVDDGCGWSRVRAGLARDP